MRFLAGILMGVVIILLSSCATAPKEPLASGEVRLLSMNVLGAGLEANSSFAINIFFEATGNPEVKRVCFYETRRWWRYCSDGSEVSYFTLGTKRAFQVRLPGIDPGSHRIECYAEYVRDGKLRRTNVVFTQISAHASPIGSGRRGCPKERIPDEILERNPSPESYQQAMDVGKIDQLKRALSE